MPRALSQHLFESKVSFTSFPIRAAKRERSLNINHVGHLQWCLYSMALCYRELILVTGNLYPAQTENSENSTWSFRWVKLARWLRNPSLQFFFMNTSSLEPHKVHLTKPAKFDSAILLLYPLSATREKKKKKVTARTISSWHRFVKKHSKGMRDANNSE